jgi:hypothetical protein
MLPERMYSLSCPPLGHNEFIVQHCCMWCGKNMVPFLVVMYILGVVLLALFILTRKILMPQGDSLPTRSLKAIRALNFLSFLLLLPILVLFGLIDLFMATTTPLLWPKAIEFLNEAFGYTTFWDIFPIILLSIFALVGAYVGKWREDYMPVNTINIQWQLVFVTILIVLGFMGAAVGVLT